MSKQANKLHTKTLIKQREELEVEIKKLRYENRQEKLKVTDLNKKLREREHESDLLERIEAAKKKGQETWRQAWSNDDKLVGIKGKKTEERWLSSNKFVSIFKKVGKGILTKISKMGSLMKTVMKTK